jgi:hypothetical protein
MSGSQYAVAGTLALAVEACSPASLALKRRSAAEVLATILDLTASVRLADRLGPAVPQQTQASDVAFRAPLLLGDYVRTRLASIESAACRRLERPFDGLRVRVADPLRLFAQLVSSDAAKSPEGARAFAAATWRTYRDYLLASVTRARSEVGELHSEVASDLRSASPRGAKLEALDAIVRGALNDAVPALCDRLATAMEPPFVEALTAATVRLTATEAVDSSAIVPWFAPHGVLGAQLARTGEIVRALLGHEARSLAVLVDTACNGAAP